MFPKWVASLVGILMGLATSGLIVWMLGVKAHAWPAASIGFWVF